jgi:DNA polymerase-1
MQFIPKRDEFIGGIFRKAFIPSDKNYVLVELDYSQAEPRLFTHYSNEPTLMRGYHAEPNIDMHAIAAQYMNIERKVAKNLNLGMMYAMGIVKLAIQLGIPYEEAQYIVGRWRRTFPCVNDFTKAASKRAEDRGYVFTILGRRARFTDPNYTYRAANRIIQGGSADILKYKMVEIENAIEADGLEDEIRMILTVHDSLVFEVNIERAEWCIKYIEEKMINLQCEPFNLRVPFKVDYKYGDNWAEATYGKAA